MNTLLLIIGLLLTASAVALIARGVIAARLRAVDTLGNIGRYGFRGVGALEPAPGFRGWLDDFFAKYADPQYDIWHGGRSKAKRHAE